MKKITLLAVNSKYTHSSLAIWCLSEGISRFSRFSRLKNDIDIIETTINCPNLSILQEITASNPDILGISVYIWNAEKLNILLKEIKACLPKTIIVLGGPEASYNAEYMLSLGADFVIQGEGEYSFPLLLDALEINSARDLETIPGLWRTLNGITFFNPPLEPVNDIMDIDPYTDEYFSRLNGRIAYLETSRGCPFQCAFCMSGESPLRFFPLEKAKNQLLKLSKSGAETIKLVDRTFNCDKDRAYELFKYVIDMDTSCRFHFEVAPDLFDNRTLSLLRTAPPGRIQLEAGLQSFYEPALKAVSRNISLEKAENNLRYILEQENIHVHIDLIAGLPFESLEHFKQSFNRAYALRAHTLQLGFLKLLPGSVLHRESEHFGIHYNTSPPYEIISNPYLCAKDLDIIKKTERALERIYNSKRFLYTAQYMLSVANISPFDFYHLIGASAEGYNTQLDKYAEQICNIFYKLPGVNTDILLDNMVLDWLSSVKGENMPSFLRLRDSRIKQLSTYAEDLLGRKIQRCEAAVLRTGEGAFIDRNDINLVTGRCKLYRVSDFSPNPDPTKVHFRIVF